jgi:hypothetical protein
MIQMNSHGHEKYPLVLIKFLHFAFKCHFISKTIRCLRCPMNKSFEIETMKTKIPGEPKLYTN